MWKAAVAMTSWPECRLSTRNASIRSTRKIKRSIEDPFQILMTTLSMQNSLIKPTWVRKIKNLVKPQKYEKSVDNLIKILKSKTKS